MTFETLKAHDGGDFNAYISIPSGVNADNPAPAIVMIQEIFGINEEMKAKCDRKAADGYIAIAPDLFWRQEPGVSLTDRTQEEWDKAFALMSGFDVDLGVKDLDTTLQFIRSHEACTGFVANIGYCLGGKLAYRMATDTDSDASVSYYGVGIDEMLDKASSITNPLLMHIAEEDEFVDKDAQSKIIEELSGHELVELYSYEEVNHAFTRLNGENYNEDAAQLANQRTDLFLKEAVKAWKKEKAAA